RTHHPVRPHATWLPGSRQWQTPPHGCRDVRWMPIPSSCSCPMPDRSQKQRRSPPFPALPMVPPASGLPPPPGPADNFRPAEIRQRQAESVFAKTPFFSCFSSCFDFVYLHFTKLTRNVLAIFG